ncbi:hypothetical protein ADILRU_0714 [Leifsonia rubra CMS 76R]|nr:hypothetical protein ADILRU_0714 [Leifsonia rubra CMS 76R]
MTLATTMSITRHWNRDPVRVAEVEEGVFVVVTFVPFI